MSIDNRIKQALKEQTNNVEDILAEEKGISDFILGSVRSNLRGWFVLVNIITLVMTGVLIWTGYRFFVASELVELVRWGVCVIAALMAQIALKQWIWAEMIRSSLMREIKRVELGVTQQVLALNTKSDE